MIIRVFEFMTKKKKKSATRHKAKTWNLKTKLVSRIRQIWQYSPHKALAKKKAKYGTSYRCSLCHNVATSVEVDHTDPIVDVVEGFKGFDEFVNRTFGGQLHVKPEDRNSLDVSFLRVLCIPCHTHVTQEQTQLRKRNRKK